MYVNQTENRITLKIKDGYSLDLLISVTIKILGSMKNKITEDKNTTSCTTSWNYRSSISTL